MNEETVKLTNKGTFKKRKLALDALRGIAVILMVEQHLIAWIWQKPEPGLDLLMSIFLILIAALGALAAPLFIVLSGIGSALFIKSYERSSTNYDKALIRRGIALMFIAYLLNIVTPYWFSWMSWFVLHLMAAGMILTTFLRRFHDRYLIAMIIAIFFMAGIVQYYLETPYYLNNYRMAGWANEPSTKTSIVGTLESVLPYAFIRIMIAEGQFPLLPWLGFYIAGIVVGRAIIDKDSRKFDRLILGTLTIGIILTILGLIIDPEKGSISWRIMHVPMFFFPSSTSLSFLLLGFILYLIDYMFKLDLRKPWSIDGRLVNLGRASLTILFLHVLIFLTFANLFGFFSILNTIETIIFIPTLLLLFAYLSRRWRLYDYRFGAEWLLRKLGKVK